jgi:glycogen synthase
MHIGYISYEYPPDTAVGGIATYVHQIAHIMQDRGHEVEVFCASTSRTVSEEITGEVAVHRLLCMDRTAFKDAILPVFETRHAKKKFDIIESPEFSADGLAIKRVHPSLPLVVKLHTPWFLIGQMNNTHLSAYKKARFIASGLLRGRLYKAYWEIKNKEDDPDYWITKTADQVHTPSASLGDILSASWGIDRNAIIQVPNPYQPGEALLAIPADTQADRITYIGRLEIRKGLVELTKAIPPVLKRYPHIKFRFVGSIQDSPKTGMDMKAYIIEKLKKYADNLEFIQVPAAGVSLIYAETDICVFPSIWENFPNTCLEAMAAGRGIVASKNGGMMDMLSDCDGGILVDPSKPRDIANALLFLLKDKAERQRKGKNARDKVLAAYNSEVIGSLTEKQFELAIRAS